MFSNANSCVKKEYVDLLVGNDINYDGGYGEDGDFGISLLKLGIPVLHNPFSANLTSEAFKRRLSGLGQAGENPRKAPEKTAVGTRCTCKMGASGAKSDADVPILQAFRTRSSRIQAPLHDDIFGGRLEISFAASAFEIAVPKTAIQPICFLCQKADGTRRTHQITMKFSLIICTYMRPKALSDLLESVNIQTNYPDEIIVVDGSKNLQTQHLCSKGKIYKNLHYFLVEDTDRGLTRQRNFGIQKTAQDTEIICFLDDDTILEPDYFEEILKTYLLFPEALGVGGYIANEGEWEFAGENYEPTPEEYFYDGWKKKDGSRFVLRKKFKLDSDVKPGFMPEFSHGRSIAFLPPTGKIYEVEQLMGGVSSFPKRVFEQFQFSTFFEGYGLYEDADFTLRLSKTGKLYVNTAAKLGHYHESSGRPNQFKYGKMVVRNGYYVWRVKHPKPSFKARLKWHAITLLLTSIRFGNTLTTSSRKEALTEALGRSAGWLSLLFNKPI